MFDFAPRLELGALSDSEILDDEKRRFPRCGSRRFIQKLFLPEENLHRTAREIKLRAELVLDEPLVRLADVLREVAEESE